MNTDVQIAPLAQDLQDLEIETFTVEELAELDQNAALNVSLCSSTTTTSSSCG